MNPDFLVIGSHDRRDARPAFVRNRVRSAEHRTGIAERASIPAGRHAS